MGATVFERALRRLLAGASLIEATSRFDPTKRAFFLGDREVLHFHGPDEIDLRLTRREISARRAALRADARIELRASTSDWLLVKGRTAADARAALALVEIAIRANG